MRPNKSTSKLLLTLLGGAFVACALSTDDPLEETDIVRNELRKGLGGVNGDADYCAPSAASQCASGEGDCDRPTDCQPGLLCTADNGPKFGMDEGTDVCVPAHCSNKVLDAAQGEVVVDCGGPCGTECGVVEPPPPMCSLPNGDPNKCTNTCICASGEGDCDRDSNCAAGLICAVDNGPKFGFTVGHDVCVPAHCTNGVRDVALGETTVDCGGVCGTECGAVVDPCGLPNGDADKCTNTCVCASGEGDCDRNSHCEAGLICANDNGPKFGFAVGHDVCVPSHCANGVLDTDLGETAVDCGGFCGTECGDADACDLPNGHPDKCTNSCPCGSGEGDCDADSNCSSGLVCALDTGGRYGLPSTTDMCQAPTCNNGAQDGDETGVDCGGSCSPCGSVATGVLALGGADSDLVRSAVVRPDGTIVIAGRFYGTLNLGGGAMTSNGASDIFVAKFDSGGGHLWSRSFGGNFGDGDHDVDVAVDSLGNVAVVGNMAGAFNGDGTASHQDGYRAFLAKYDANGNYLWGHVFGGSDSTQVAKFTGVAFLPNGNVVTTGAFQGSASFGGSTFTSAGDYDIVVAHYTSNGLHVWSRQYGSTGKDEGVEIAVDSNSQPVIAGGFAGTVTFGSTVLTSAGQTDALLLRMTAAGAPVWALQFGGKVGDQAADVAIAPDGRVAVTGFFQGTADFGAGPVTSAGSTDVFTAVVDSAGTQQWAKTFGGVDQDVGMAVGFDSATGDLVNGGLFSATVAGLTADGTEVTSAGSYDMFIARMHSTSGAVKQSATYGSTGTDAIYGFGVTTGTLVAAARFNGTVSFGSAGSVSSNGADDIAILRMGF